MISTPTRLPRILGTCDPRFEPLRKAFGDNFSERGELGAALAVVVDSELVVDLWGGWADEARTRPWSRDTLVNVFSVGKAMAAVALLVLVQRGDIDLDAPVAGYWPRFAAAGKEGVTVRMLLGHRAGLPAVRELLADTAMYDWDTMAAALAAETPWWEPGAAHGYHVNTFGFLVGEVVRRVSGRPIDEFFEAAVASPLGADFRFGVRPGDAARVADFQFTLETLEGRNDPPADSEDERRLLLARAYFNPPGVGGIEGYVNTPEWRAAVMPSTNGHATARAVACIYGALASGSGPLDPDTLRAATEVASFGPDRVLGRISRFGLGFQLTHPDRPLGHGPRSFGHFGVGGSVGFADPDARVGFGYTMNHGGPRWQNPRNRVLIDALYDCL